jgi:hypothetical protein
MEKGEMSQGAAGGPRTGVHLPGVDPRRDRGPGRV